MCRIAGFWDFSKQRYRQDSETILRSMTDSMAHGGPDDAGYQIVDKGVGLGQRRLSVIDLTDGGHQPMHTEKYVIVFNGEIYNYQEIKDELKSKGYTFNSNSDTEVILRSFEVWGYDSVHKFRGMFAIALWNKLDKKLLLCRDRVGVKPMYWYYNDGLLLFASELKAFHEHPELDKTIDHEAVSLFLQTGYIRSPYCIFKHAKKLEPGSFLEINEKQEITKWKYWDVNEIYRTTMVSTKSEEELITECEQILKESFQLRMVADVPVGMFLSGGIDSSLVTALLQAQSKTPLKTFTIGFEQKEFNEATFAKSIASHIGTDHTELYCSEEHFKEIIPHLPEFYDEPFGDSSAIPTYLVSKLAREHVTVSLSADAGDEIFTGYTKHLLAIEYFNKIKRIPRPIRKMLSKVMTIMPISILNFALSLTSLKGKTEGNSNRYRKMAQVFECDSVLDFMYKSSQIMVDEDLKKLHKVKPTNIFEKDLEMLESKTCSLLGAVDIGSYLEGDIMAKVDRATMRVALEGREPFLDHHIIEFGLSLPDHMKLRNGVSKWILREILYKYVPKELIDRPKMGFGIPVEEWLHSSLKEALVLMKNDREFASAFLLDTTYLDAVVSGFLEEKNNHSSYLIWFLYCLHQWYNKWIQ